MRVTILSDRKSLILLIRNLRSVGVALQKYGYNHEAQRLAYRWLHM